MNYFSLLAGFISGIALSAIFFIFARTQKLRNYFGYEKVKDLSYFGRTSMKKSKKR
jgi:hypothetical protein